MKTISTFITIKKLVLTEPIQQSRRMAGFFYAKSYPEHKGVSVYFSKMQMYFIAIVLPPELDEKILKYKTMMFEKYHCKVGLKSPAHITLVPPFWMQDEKEQQLISDINFLSQRFHPFLITTDNFSAFKPRTLFIAVAPNKTLDELKQATDAFFQNNDFYKLKLDSRPFHPHITIATRDLYKKSFFEIWPWFAEKEFLHEWKAEGISLLKHNQKNWDVVFTSQFKSFETTI
jgi:2'-5' RNA ligase